MKKSATPLEPQDHKSLASPQLESNQSNTGGEVIRSGNEIERNRTSLETTTSAKNATLSVSPPPHSNSTSLEPIAFGKHATLNASSDVHAKMLSGFIENENGSKATVSVNQSGFINSSIAVTSTPVGGNSTKPSKDAMLRTTNATGTMPLQLHDTHVENESNHQSPEHSKHSGNYFFVKVFLALSAVAVVIWCSRQLFRSDDGNYFHNLDARTPKQFGCTGDSNTSGQKGFYV
jgi:hypothetical protein